MRDVLEKRRSTEHTKCLVIFRVISWIVLCLHRPDTNALLQDMRLGPYGNSPTFSALFLLR